MCTWPLVYPAAPTKSSTSDLQASTLTPPSTATQLGRASRLLPSRCTMSTQRQQSATSAFQHRHT